MSVSFAEAIVPLFGARDISCMARYGVPLTDLSYMSDATARKRLQLMQTREMSTPIVFRP